MGVRRFCLLLAAALLLAGCWDKLELEDQLFPVTLAVDPGERSRYRMTLQVPIPGGVRAGILGGQADSGPTSVMLTVEADTVAQGIFILNASVARRITLRHLRAVVIGEELARAGLRDLLSELLRSGEVHTVASVWVARSSATQVVAQARPTGEMSPGKISEGLLLVQKSLHMAPPARLLQLITNSARIGADPFVPIVGLNRQITGTGRPSGAGKSAIAGDLDRMGENPMEVAGTAVFRDFRLAGFLTVDQTQAFLALRGEMGKAYVTLSDPLEPGRQMTIRFQQENLPQYRSYLSGGRPRVEVRILLEGEVLSGTADYMDVSQRRRVERVAARFIEDQMREVLANLQEWEADPVGFGMLFRSHFARYDDWQQFNWRRRIRELKVEVSVEMRLRRFGMIHSGMEERGGEE